LVKSKPDFSTVRLKVAVDNLSEKKQTEIAAAIVQSFCEKDPHVARVLTFYGVKV
jgi:hypothetical protein